MRRAEQLTPAQLTELGVFVRPGFLDEAACARVSAAMDLGGLEAAEIYVNGYVVDDRVRKTFDVDVDPATIQSVERAFEDIRSEVACVFGVPLTGAEGPGFLRYPTGGFYRAHRDQLDETDQDSSRRVSLVLFLTDAGGGGGRSCDGGSLRLYGLTETAQEGSPIDIVPVAGTLVAFRSHLLHEVLPVTAGVRDAIVDWFY